jgi:hypothetical protein
VEERAAAGLPAPEPARLIEGGLPTQALVAHVLVGQYADHLALYRQSQIYARQGIELDRSTLADWVGRAAAELRAQALACFVEDEQTRFSKGHLGNVRSGGGSHGKAHNRGAPALSIGTTLGAATDALAVDIHADVHHCYGRLGEQLLHRVRPLCIRARR